MTPPTVLLLGGYGNTGRALAGLLLEHTDVKLRVAARNGAKAQAEAAGWNSRYPGDRVRGLAADASDRVSLRAACEGAQWLIAASSTSGQAGIVAEVALEAGLDYMDPQFSRAKLAVLTSLEAIAAGILEERAEPRAFLDMVARLTAGAAPAAQTEPSPLLLV